MLYLIRCKTSIWDKLTSKVFIELIDGVSIKLIFLYTSIESDFSLTLSFKALTHWHNFSQPEAVLVLLKSNHVWSDG